MSRFLFCLMLAGLASGCAISLGTGPAAPPHAQVAYGNPPSYAPPPTAHTDPTPAAVQPSASPAAPPPAQPAAVPPAAVARVDQPAPAPVSPPKGKHQTTKPAAPKTKQKLRFKDIWVEQTHPKTAPKMDRGPMPAGRLASAAPNRS